MALNKTTDKLSSNNLFIITLLICLIVVGVTVLASKSLITTIVRDGKVVSKKMTALNSLKNDNKAAPELVKAYDALGPTAIKLNSALPVTTDFPSVISSMENMGKLSGVKVKEVSPSLLVTVDAPVTAGATAGAGAAGATSSAAPVAAPQTFAFAIEISGTYVNTLKFLNTIETSVRPLRVVDVKFSGSGSSLSTQIDVETYYQAKAVLPYGTETVK